MNVRSTGTARITVPADTATLSLRVAAEHPNAQRAYALRGKAREVARRVLAAAAEVEVHGESVSEYAREGHTTAVWECQVRAVGRFDGLREVLARLAEVPDIQVRGPEWRLSPEGHDAAREQLLREAAVAARREAEVLATALGATLGSVARIDAGKQVDVGMQPHRMLLTGEVGSLPPLPPRTLELDLEPELIPLRESVTVEFALR